MASLVSRLDLLLTFVDVLLDDNMFRLLVENSSWAYGRPGWCSFWLLRVIFWRAVLYGRFGLSFVPRRSTELAFLIRDSSFEVILDELLFIKT